MPQTFIPLRRVLAEKYTNGTHISSSVFTNRALNQRISDSNKSFYGKRYNQPYTEKTAHSCNVNQCLTGALVGKKVDLEQTQPNCEDGTEEDGVAYGKGGKIIRRGQMSHFWATEEHEYA
ncbi:hypothetical protein HHI36_020919 [Cryptolaemus montrouzieri]|uniref:Uncharacterized protein n=1 Tax=Cryptolaemus montrouzieri TaxID=559131 RepID=A0ABD2NBR1_9CUCU